MILAALLVFPLACRSLRAVPRRLFRARRPAAARAAASARTRVRFGCVPLTLRVVSRTYMHPTARWLASTRIP